MTPTATPVCSELEIFTWEITFDPPQANPGDIVEISAIVHNTGGRDVSYTEVFFLVEQTPLDPSDDPNPRMIGSPVVLTDILMGDSDTATILWDTTGLESLSYPVYVMTFNTVPEECDLYNYTQTDYMVPIELIAFDAHGEDHGICLTWSTATEIDNLGFHIYRATDYSGEFIRINEAMIPGAGTSFTQQDYTVSDDQLSNSVPYFYRLVSVDSTGGTTGSYIVAGIPNNSGLAISLDTTADRKLYSVDRPLNVMARVINSGPAANAGVQMSLVIDGRYSGDIVPYTTVPLTGDLNVIFDLIHHDWLGTEPRGEYLIISAVSDPATGSLIDMDITEFRFLGQSPQ